jgi:hypothetical protein
MATVSNTNVNQQLYSMQQNLGWLVGESLNEGIDSDYG